MAERIDGSNIINPQTLTFKTGETHNGKDIYYCSGSGVAILNFKGLSANWKYETFHLTVPIDTSGPLINEARPEGDFLGVLTAKSWCVYSGLNSFYMPNLALDTGFAVDDFKLLRPNSLSENFITIEVNVALRGGNGEVVLYRVGYSYELLLHFDSWFQRI